MGKGEGCLQYFLRVANSETKMELWSIWPVSWNNTDNRYLESLDSKSHVRYSMMSHCLNKMILRPVVQLYYQANIITVKIDLPNVVPASEISLSLDKGPWCLWKEASIRRKTRLSLARKITAAKGLLWLVSLRSRRSGGYFTNTGAVYFDDSACDFSKFEAESMRTAPSKHVWVYHYNGGGTEFLSFSIRIFFLGELGQTWGGILTGK